MFKQHHSSSSLEKGTAHQRTSSLPRWIARKGSGLNIGISWCTCSALTPTFFFPFYGWAVAMSCWTCWRGQVFPSFFWRLSPARPQTNNRRPTKQEGTDTKTTALSPLQAPETQLCESRRSEWVLRSLGKLSQRISLSADLRCARVSFCVAFTNAGESTQDEQKGYVWGWKIPTKRREVTIQVACGDRWMHAKADLRTCRERPNSRR